MTRKQIVFVLTANAVISLLISLMVVGIGGWFLRDRIAGPVVMPTEAAIAASASSEPIEPAATSTIHVVQAGDTISGLALKYDVKAEDIVAANQLQNPNFLQVGMELVIPVAGLANVTATLTPAPTATETPIPFEPPSAQMTATALAEAGATATPLPTPVPLVGELSVEITEVAGAGQLDQEAVRVTNTGERNADMAGWTLSDADGNVYTFSGLTLWKGGSIFVHTKVGSDTPPNDFFWGKLQPIWLPGETATLRDAQGQKMATLVVQP
jgi:hypothetical protein